MKTCIKDIIARLINTTHDLITSVPLARMEPGWVSVAGDEPWEIDEIKPSRRLTTWGCFVDWMDEQCECALYRWTDELPF